MTKFWVWPWALNKIRPSDAYLQSSNWEIEGEARQVLGHLWLAWDIWDTVSERASDIWWYTVSIETLRYIGGLESVSENKQERAKVVITLYICYCMYLMFVSHIRQYLFKLTYFMKILPNIHIFKQLTNIYQVLNFS